MAANAAPKELKKALLKGITLDRCKDVHAKMARLVNCIK